MVKKIRVIQPPSTWIHIFGNVQTESGLDKCAELSQVMEVLEHLQYIGRCFNEEPRFTLRYIDRRPGLEGAATPPDT
jgi:hypothetical protein